MSVTKKKNVEFWDSLTDIKDLFVDVRVPIKEIRSKGWNRKVLYRLYETKTINYTKQKEEKEAKLFEKSRKHALHQESIKH